MGDFSIVNRRVWNDEKFRLFSDDGRLLWLYCLTNPHMNGLGCYVMSKATMADDLQWPMKRLERTFSELLANKVLRYDPHTRLLLLPHYLRYNRTFKNERSKVAVLRQIEHLPKCSILQEFIKLANSYLTVSEELANCYLNVGSDTETYTETEKETETRELSANAEPSLPASQKVTSQELAESWNEICGSEGFPLIELPMNGSRLKKATLRLREHPTVDFWERVLNGIIASPFCRGENDKGWRVTFDWLLDNDRNALKVAEGNFAETKKASR